VASLSGFFSRNWTLKLSAFGIALLLWVAVRAEAPNLQDLPGVPVRVDLVDPQWALIGDPLPATVTVRFGGPSRELIRRALERPAIVIPLEAVGSGDTVVVLRPSWVRIQDRPGVIAEDIQPSSVRISLERIGRADLPPAPQWEGSLPAHLALSASPLIEPAGLRVSGPGSRLEGLDSIPLRAFDLGAVSASGSFPVEVDTEGLAGLLIQPMMVQIEVRVEDRIERVVSGIPIVLPETLEGNAALQLLPTTGAIVLRGARSVVERADPTALRFVVQVEPGSLPAAGQEGEFPLRLTGLPPLLEGELRVTAAVVRNRSRDAP
jgi:YbbR domain-containing protein